MPDIKSRYDVVSIIRVLAEKGRFLEILSWTSAGREGSNILVTASNPKIGGLQAWLTQMIEDYISGLEIPQDWKF
jgi:hypothetical protein